MRVSVALRAPRSRGADGTDPPIRSARPRRALIRRGRRGGSVASEVLAELGREALEVGDVRDLAGALAGIVAVAGAIGAGDQAEAFGIGALRHDGAEPVAQPRQARLVA